jgi:hypothetical protein
MRAMREKKFERLLQIKITDGTVGGLAKKLSS